MAARRSRKKKRGKGRRNLVALAVLVALIGGALTWNYQRNLAAENAEVRPYRTLSDADLAALIGAIETEAEAADRRYARARDAARGASGGAGWSAFEQAQQRRRAVQALGSEASGHGALLEEMRREQARRAGQGTGVQRVLQLALRLPL